MKTELIETLIIAGVLPQSSLDEADKNNKTPLLETLLSKGHGSEDDVLKIIKNKLGYEIVDNNTLSKIPQLALQSIPINFIIDYHVLPFYVDENVLNIAMADPTYEECLNELNFLFEKNIMVFGAKLSEINQNINKYFNLNLFTNFKHIKTKNFDAPTIPKPRSIPKIKEPVSMNDKTSIKQVVFPNPFDETKIKIKLPPTDSIYDKTPMPKKPDFVPHQGLPSIPKDPEDIILEKINKDLKKSTISESHIDYNKNDLKNENVRAYRYEHKEYIEYFENQKKLLEIQFEAKIAELKEKISRLEEDQNLNKLRRELEDKIQNTRTLEKLSEIENMRQYNEIHNKIQTQMNSQNNSSNDTLKNELMALHSAILKISEDQSVINNKIKEQNASYNEKKIETLAFKENYKEEIKNELNEVFLEDQNVFKPTIKNDYERNHYDDELEKIEKNHTVIQEILLESNFSQVDDNNKNEELAERDSTVIRNIKEEIEYNTNSNIKKAPEMSIDNMFVENININTKSICEAKDRDDLFTKSFVELQKISNKIILLFVRFENIVGVAGFGDKVNENVCNYKDTILIPSMFKKVYDLKNVYSGAPSDDNISKNFYLHFASPKPQHVVIVPILLKKRVFAMLYAEDVKDLDLLTRVTKAMTSSFENIFNK